MNYPVLPERPPVPHSKHGAVKLILAVFIAGIACGYLLALWHQIAQIAQIAQKHNSGLSGKTINERIVK